MQNLSAAGLFLTFCVGTLWRKHHRNARALKIAIIVHGGAYAIPDELREACERGCRVAASKGYAVLQAGGSAVDAVEVAVQELENNPVFDAGYGSALTEDSLVEMDAVIMDGRTLKAGAVACVTSVRNPISLARKVMENTNHVLLVGRGADKFARRMGFEEVSVDELTTPEAKEELAHYMKEENPYGSSVSSEFNNTIPKVTSGHDTTGCVCIDINGNLCAGTSTGGITAKMSGRVGDSPIIGSGVYCSNDAAGISTTGHGESIMKMCLAKEAATFISNGADPTTALTAALANMKARVDGCGGMICIDSKGQIGKAFSTSRMSWASISGAPNQHPVQYSGIEKYENNIW